MSEEILGVDIDDDDDDDDDAEDSNGVIDDDDVGGDDDDDDSDDGGKVKVGDRSVSKKELIESYKKIHAEKSQAESTAAHQQTVQARQAKQQQNYQIQQSINNYSQHAQQWAREGIPNWKDLLENNPHEYMKQKEVHAARNQMYQQALQQQQYLTQQTQAEEQERTLERISVESKKLNEMIPGWNKKTTRDKEERDLVDYLSNAGYTKEEMRNLNYSKASNISLIVKAMRYDKMVNKAKSSKTPDVVARPVPVIVGGRAVSKKSPDKMNDKEFADWRHRQIASR